MGACNSTNQSHQINALLPPEILHQVFRLLPPRDMKNVMLVCQLWREVGEAPGLWAWVVLRGTWDNMSSMAEVLDSRRIRTVRKLMVWSVSEEILKAVARHQGLNVMEVGGEGLSVVDPNLLVSAVALLEKGKVENTRQQGEAVLTAICQGSGGGFREQKLELGRTCLSSVDSGLLARAVSQLEEGSPLAGLVTQGGAIVCLLWALYGA